MRGLNEDFTPSFVLSSYRIFGKEEQHVSRVCKENVLLLVIKGTLCFLENGERKDISAGEYYIQEKNLKQSGIPAELASEYYYIHFMGEIADSVSPGIPIRGSFDIQRMKDLINALEISKILNGSKTSIQASFLQIVSFLANENKNAKSKLSSDLALFIMNNISSELSLNTLSSKFGYCKNSIIQIFKKEFGVTPYEYIIQKRIELAKNLMISSNNPVEIIAQKSGFGNYINMYKAFVKSENCSPNEYRLKNST